MAGADGGDIRPVAAPPCRPAPVEQGGGAAVELFDAIHSVDRPSLVEALGNAMAKPRGGLDCFVQVNIGAEPQKGGVVIAELPAPLEQARRGDQPLAGLMCAAGGRGGRALFRAAGQARARQRARPACSMGMSGDFETAVMPGGHACAASARRFFGERGMSGPVRSMRSCSISTAC